MTAPAPSERPFGPDTSDTIDALRAEVEKLKENADPYGVVRASLKAQITALQMGDEQRVRDLTRHITRADKAEAERDDAVAKAIAQTLTFAQSLAEKQNARNDALLKALREIEAALTSRANVNIRLFRAKSIARKALASTDAAEGTEEK